MSPGAIKMPVYSAGNKDSPLMVSGRGSGGMKFESQAAVLNHKISPTQNGPLQSICVHHTGAVPVREYTVRFDSTPVPNFIANINCVGSELTLGDCPMNFIEAPRFDCQTINAAVACQGSQFIPNTFVVVFSCY